MKVLIVGSGGREHAIAWKVSQSQLAQQVWVAPGNGGTASVGTNIPIAANDVASLADFAERNEVDITIVGPEAPLAAGIADEFAARGLAIFGPSRAAATIEASKAFAKDFMRRHAIPTARYAVFRDAEHAIRYLHSVEYPVVIKASGLAGGKGVLLPNTPEEARDAVERVLLHRIFGKAGDELIIEERLHGEEVSVLAFSDGMNVSLMPAAQDHKRAYDGDRGPNTGGMGAYAPAPVALPPLLERVRREIIEPAVRGLREEGMPYIGVLYAGLICTSEGPKVLEFNCRLGDPETQVILPLLEGDLLDIVMACVEGGLSNLSVRWREEAALTVVLAAGGYPDRYTTGHEIFGLHEAIDENVIIFHAGTRYENGRFVTAGGRVLNVTGVGRSLQEARDRAYAAVERVSFQDMYFRRDIGSRALFPKGFDHE